MRRRGDDEADMMMILMRWYCCSRSASSNRSRPPVHRSAAPTLLLFVRSEARISILMLRIWELSCYRDSYRKDISLCSKPSPCRRYTKPSRYRFNLLITHIHIAITITFNLVNVMSFLKFRKILKKKRKKTPPLNALQSVSICEFHCAVRLHVCVSVRVTLVFQIMTLVTSQIRAQNKGHLHTSFHNDNFTLSPLHPRPVPWQVVFKW